MKKGYLLITIAIVLTLAIIAVVSCKASLVTDTTEIDETGNATMVDNDGTDDKSVSYKSISMDEAKELFATSDDYVIVDVRREDEYDEGHIPDAINIPNEDIIDTKPSQLPDEDQLIYVYCRSGNRSKQAAEKLVNMGYTNIVEFGGIIDWTGEIEKNSDNQLDIDTLFEDAETVALTADDFQVNYNGFVIDINTTVDDVMSTLGIPDGYEDNNGGYISSENGFWWGLEYPEYNSDDLELKVVMKSNEGYDDNTTIEKSDSTIESVQLFNYPTNKGIKKGSSIADVKNAYGKPESADFYEYVYILSYHYDNCTLSITIDCESHEVMYIRYDFR